MVVGDKISASLIYRKSNSFSYFDAAFRHLADMTDLGSLQFNRILYDKFCIRCADHTGIGNLSTHCRIKWSLFYEDSSFHAFF